MATAASLTVDVNAQTASFTDGMNEAVSALNRLDGRLKGFSHSTKLFNNFIKGAGAFAIFSTVGNEFASTMNTISEYQKKFATGAISADSANRELFRSIATGLPVVGKFAEGGMALGAILGNHAQILAGAAAAEQAWIDKVDASQKRMQDRNKTIQDATDMIRELRKNQENSAAVAFGGVGAKDKISLVEQQNKIDSQLGNLQSQKTSAIANSSIGKQIAAIDKNIAEVEGKRNKYADENWKNAIDNRLTELNQQKNSLLRGSEVGIDVGVIDGKIASLQKAKDGLAKVMQTDILGGMQGRLDVFGKTEGDIEILRLKVLGADDATIKWAQTLADASEKLKGLKVGGDTIDAVDTSVVNAYKDVQDLLDAGAINVDVANSAFGVVAQQANEAYAKVQEAMDKAAASDANEKLKKALKDQADALAKIQAEAQSVFDATRTPAEKLEEKLQRMNDLLNENKITWDTYARAVNSAYIDFANKAETGPNTASVAAREIRFTQGYRGGNADREDPMRDVADNTKKQLEEAKRQREVMEEIRDNYGSDAIRFGVQGMA